MEIGFTEPIPLNNMVCSYDSAIAMAIAQDKIIIRNGGWIRSNGSNNSLISADGVGLKMTLSDYIVACNDASTRRANVQNYAHRYRALVQKCTNGHC